ncbi:hypothetical protein ALP62_05490 [Pseudomonas syringae pv. aceris]|nr:hypothetical protein ALP62_05490 [Pseudomonas syringae pv. aceris]
MADHRLQLPAQARQFDAGRSGFFAGRSGLLGDIAHVDDAAADFLGNRALLFSGGGNLLVHRLNARHRLRDAAQRRASLTAEGHAADGQFTAVEHDAGHLARTALQRSDQCFDLHGGLLRTLCQAADFVGNHGKTTSGFTRTRCFDSSVERQQVGLFGHRLDDVHHLADLVAFLLQLSHGVGRATHFVGQSLDLGDRFTHHLVTVTRFAVGVGSGLRGLFGVTRHFCNRRRHLVHSGGDLVGFDFLAVDASAGLFSNRRQFFGGTGDLYDAVANTANQLAQCGAHALDALLQNAELISACHGQGLGQVTGCDTIDHRQGFLQRTGNLPGNDDCGDDAQNDRQQCADDLSGTCLCAFLIAAIQLQLVHVLADLDDILALRGHFLARLDNRARGGLEVLQGRPVRHQRGFQLPELIGLSAAEGCLERIQILDGRIQFRDGCLLGLGCGIGGVTAHFIACESQVIFCVGDKSVLLEAVGVSRVHVFDFSHKLLEYREAFDSMGRQLITSRSAGLVATAHIVEGLLVVSDHDAQLIEHFHVFGTFERGPKFFLIRLEAVQRSLHGFGNLLVAVGHHVLEACHAQFGQLGIE